MKTTKSDNTEQTKREVAELSVISPVLPLPFPEVEISPVLPFPVLPLPFLEVETSPVLLLPFPEVEISPVLPFPEVETSPVVLFPFPEVVELSIKHSKKKKKI